MEINQRGIHCTCRSKNVGRQLTIWCAECNKRFHAKCVDKVKWEKELLDRFNCLNCELSCGESTFLDRKFCYADSKNGIVQLMSGHQLTLDKFIETGFTNPILVNKIEGLNIKVPDKNTFTFETVKRYCENKLLNVIDVKTQDTIPIYLYELVERFSIDPKDRTSVLNSISFEISDQKLDKHIKGPAVVYELSWIDQYWRNVKGINVPPINKFCLLSMQMSWTDFHIDFGGSSVWYHVVTGKKIFYIAKPTEHNLKEYAKWYYLPFNERPLLAKSLDKCYKLVLMAGQTLFIPSGYLHGVRTTCDSIVFGGNYFHSLNIEMQINIVNMEIDLNFHKDYRVEHIELIHWCAVENVIKFLNKTSSTDFILSVKILISKLEEWDYNCRDKLTFETEILLRELNNALSEAEIRVNEQMQNVDPLKCKICHKKFFYKSKLTEHLPSHSDDTKFECQVDLCGAKFKREGNLKKTYEKPLKY